MKGQESQKLGRSQTMCSSERPRVKCYSASETAVPVEGVSRWLVLVTPSSGARPNFWEVKTARTQP